MILFLIWGIVEFVAMMFVALIWLLIFVAQGVVLLIALAMDGYAKYRDHREFIAWRDGAIERVAGPPPYSQKDLDIVEMYIAEGGLPSGKHAK